MVCYNHLLCHTPYVIHATTTYNHLLYALTRYLYHASYYALRHVSCVTCHVSRVSLMSVLVHGQLKLPIHERQKHPRTEGALARSAPSELRPNNHQAKNVSKASRPLLRPLGGTNNNQATSNDSDVLNYYCVRPDCYFCKKCEGLTDS